MKHRPPVNLLDPLEETGIKWTLKISKQEDLQRMVVAGLNATIYIPELDFEVPSVPKGMISTTQGLFESFIDDLEMNQKERQESQPELYEQIKKIIEQLTDMQSCKESILPFHMIIDDPSGNSFISNPFAPLMDVNLKEEHYIRTKEQLFKMGYISDKEMAEDKELREKYEQMKQDPNSYSESLKKVKNYKFTDKDVQSMMAKMQGMDRKKDAHKLDYSKTIQEQDLDSRLSIIQVNCFMCNKPGEMKTYTCEIPFFKEIVLMAFNCLECGYRDVDVKTAGKISLKAKKITLNVITKEDLNRDVFKSESATVKIKELDFEMSPGSMGSFYTTVEGLLLKLLEELKENNPFVGDSADKEQTKAFNEFLDKLEKMKDGSILPFVLELDDPLDNCFVLNPNYPNEDHNVLIEEYERTSEQNEKLGINQMKV